MKNLEELVNFKVRTLADQFQGEQYPLQGSSGPAPYREDRSQQRLAAPQGQSQASVDALKKICDPLLANRHYPKLLSKKAAGAAKNLRQLEEDQRQHDIHEIPDDWKQPPKSWNAYGPRKEGLPAIIDSKSLGQGEKPTGKTGAKDAADTEGQKEQRDGHSRHGTGRVEEGSESFREKREKFKKDQDELRQTGELLKREHGDALASQESNFQKKLVDKQLDPVKLLKHYFEGKNKPKQQEFGK